MEIVYITKNVSSTLQLQRYMKKNNLPFSFHFVSEQRVMMEICTKSKKLCQDSISTNIIKEDKCPLFFILCRDISNSLQSSVFLLLFHQHSAYSKMEKQNCYRLILHDSSNSIKRMISYTIKFSQSVNSTHHFLLAKSK